MKIILKKTKASLNKRKELQAQIMQLLDKFDVPIFIAYKVIFKGNDEILFDFSKGEIKNQVHIMVECTLINKNKKKKKSLLVNTL